MSLVISTMFTAFPYGPNGSKRGIHLSVRSTKISLSAFLSCAAYHLPVCLSHVSVHMVALENETGSHNFAIRIAGADVHVRKVKLSPSVFLAHACLHISIWRHEQDEQRRRQLRIVQRLR